MSFFTSVVPVGARHPHALHRFALEIELDQHDRFLADHPAVVPGIDRDDLRRLEFDDASVGVLNVNLAVRQEPDVGVQAQVGADDRPHVA